MPRSATTLPPQGHYLRRRIRTAGFARHAAGFSIVLVLVAIPIYRLGGVTAPALIGVLLLAAALACLALALSLIGLARAWFGAAIGGGRAFRAAILSLFALAPFGAVVFMASVNPMTNMAYTDAYAPDVSAAIDLMGSDRAAGNAPSMPILPPVLPSRRYELAAPEVAVAVQTTLDDLGWEVTRFDAVDAEETAADDPLGVIRGDGAIPVPTSRADIDRASPALALPVRDEYAVEAVARDFLFALPSDVSIRIVQDDTETAVDMRSISRITGLDLGQNRRFVQDFYESLDLLLAGPEAVAGG